MKPIPVFADLRIIGLLLLAIGAAISLISKDIGMPILTIGAILLGVKIAIKYRKFRVNQYRKELQRRHDTYGDLWRYREDEDKQRFDM